MRLIIEGIYRPALLLGKSSLIKMLALSLSLTVGCAPTLHESLNQNSLQSALGPTELVNIDIDASEIRMEESTSIKADPRRLRRELAFVMQEALNGPTQRATQLGQTRPSRYLLEVHSLQHSFLKALFPCLIYFAIFGCPTDTIRAEISLTIDYRGELYRASTSGEASFNHFQHGFSSYSPEVRVLGIAIADALQMIVRSIKNTEATQSGGAQ